MTLLILYVNYIVVNDCEGTDDVNSRRAKAYDAFDMLRKARKSKNITANSK